MAQSIETIPRGLDPDETLAAALDAIGRFARNGELVVKHEVLPEAIVLRWVEP